MYSATGSPLGTIENTARATFGISNEAHVAVEVAPGEFITAGTGADDAKLVIDLAMRGCMQ